MTGTSSPISGMARGEITSIRIRATPSPASRPRVKTKPFPGTYYAKSYADWMAACQAQMAHLKGCFHEGCGPLGCRLVTIVERPKTTKLSCPRGDVDNYAKAPLDAATKAGVWPDDSRVVLLLTSKRWAEKDEDPGAIFEAFEINDKTLKEHRLQ